MSLIPGPATSPQDRLFSLTATVTELTKTVQQGMAQQKQFLAAPMMDNKKHNFSPHPSPLIKFGQINVNGLCFPIR
ncbi:hypothetical protein RhiirC2_804123 [Rhizophagus irregularis]|uniref:Uncharacterized protein n=1 Tax=Rhizophagus irregularis TaxID=588596 RepID=A0A2N1L4A1_9GLOM|nr:hypothetical protein RhiirC2_804123 [Rhizophagus irregularis]